LLASVRDAVPKSKAQLYQDLWVLSETRRKKGGFFVEIGAFDGVRNSNTFLLEKELGWKGILVEPNPDCHQRLRQNRSAVISTKAVYSKRGTVEFLRVPEDPEMSSIADHAFDDKHADLRGGHSDAISVETLTLEDLLHEHDAPKTIDYISIDTEGSELEILSTFDFAKYDVRLISVEHNHFRARDVETERLLRRAGFKRVYRHVSRFDAWYKRVRPAETQAETCPA
jgi:FkbM family methyltransferase